VLFKILNLISFGILRYIVYNRLISLYETSILLKAERNMILNECGEEYKISFAYNRNENLINITDGLIEVYKNIFDSL